MALALWVSPDDLTGAADPAQANEAARTATFIVWALSGRRYSGQHRVTELYECECSGQPRIVRTPSGPVLVEGAVVNVQLPCDCQGTKAHRRLRLRGTPVRAVHSVSRDGVPLGTGEYSVSRRSVLVLQSGEVCGLEVDYTYGSNPPAAGRHAALKLAEELILGWNGSDECALPDRVTNVSREGISFTVIDKQDFLDDLRTGIYEVDLFLRAVNPDRARNRAKIFDPGAPRAK